MTLTTVLLAASAYLVAYFGTEWWLAKRDLSRAWATAREQHQGGYTGEFQVMPSTKYDTHTTRTEGKMIP